MAAWCAARFSLRQFDAEVVGQARVAIAAAEQARQDHAAHIVAVVRRFPVIAHFARAAKLRYRFAGDAVKAGKIDQPQVAALGAVAFGQLW